MTREIYATFVVTCSAKFPSSITSYSELVRDIRFDEMSASPFSGVVKVNKARQGFIASFQGYLCAGILLVSKCTAL